MAKRKAVEGKKLPDRRRSVQRKRTKKKRAAIRKKPARPARVATASKQTVRRSKSAKKTAKKAAKKKAAKKKAVKKKAAKKRARPLRVLPHRPKRVSPQRKLAKDFAKILPKDWVQRPLSKFGRPDLERMAAQVAQRIAEKIGQNGYGPDDVETSILLALIGAEQRGTLNHEYYQQAGEYDGYETPQDVYKLWIYS